MLQRSSRWPATFGILVLTQAWSACAGSRAPGTVSPSIIPGDAQMEQFVDSVLALMTLEEKLGQLNQPAGPGPATGPTARADSHSANRTRRRETGRCQNVRWRVVPKVRGAVRQPGHREIRSRDPATRGFA